VDDTEPEHQHRPGLVPRRCGSELPPLRPFLYWSAPDNGSTAAAFCVPVVGEFSEKSTPSGNITHANHSLSMACAVFRDDFGGCTVGAPIAPNSGKRDGILLRNSNDAHNDDYRRIERTL
jgi:hypothetical protein